MKSGRVYIRSQNAQGPALDFSAERSGDVFQMGDTISAGAGEPVVTLRVSAPGGEAQTLEWIRNGEVMGAQKLAAGIQRRRVEVRDGEWFSLIIRDPSGQATVLSNAIYFRTHER